MITIFWNGFEILINFYQGFIMSYFIYKLLIPKSPKQARFLMAISGLVFGSTVTALNYVSIYEGLASALYILILFVFSLISFKDNIIKKIMASVVAVAILLLITTMELNLISSFRHISVTELILNRGLLRFITLIIIQVSLWLSLLLLSKLFRYSDDYTFTDWMPIIFVLVFSFVLMSISHALSLSINADQRIYINLAYFVILILNFAIFYVIHTLFLKNKQINEMKLSALREQHMEQFVDNANSQYESIRKIRHDIKDRLSTVYDLLSKGKTEEAMEFIADSSNVVDRIETFVQTNNVVANAIINSKLSIASALGIKVSCITISDFDGINELDLCDLLGNTLENAITACKNMSPDNNRFIYLEIGKEKNIYSFLIKNSIPRSVIGNNPELRTTKTDKTQHGFGIAIIKDIANKYNGRYDYYEIDNSFCCSVILKT